MTKRQWLVLTPVAVLLGFGFSQSVIAAPQMIQAETCTNCITQADNSNNAAPDDSGDQDSDYDNNDYDNSQDFDQDQSQEQPQNPAPETNPAAPPQAPMQTPVGNAPAQNTGSNGNPS